MAADPFGRAPGDGKGKHPRSRRQTQKTGRNVDGKERQSDIERQQCRQARDRERDEPPELGDVDEERTGDPIEAGDEKAEPEGAAESKRRERRSTAVVEPQQPGERHHQHRDEVDGRQRRRGRGAQQHGEPVASPTAESSHPGRQAAQRRVGPSAGPDAKQCGFRHPRLGRRPRPASGVPAAWRSGAGRLRAPQTRCPRDGRSPRRVLGPARPG